MVKDIWKSYIWTADKDVNESDPCSNVHYLGSSESKAWKKKKIQACMGFEPMTSAIPVQRALHRYRRGHGFAEVMSSNPVQAWIFFRPYFHYCLSSAHYCEDHFHSRLSYVVLQFADGLRQMGL